MAQLKEFFIPSRTEGKTWKIYSYKPQGRPAYVGACEGELTESGTPGIRFFRTILFGDRRYSVNVAGGRATKRALYDAACELLRQLADSSCILPEDADRLTSTLFVA